MKQNTSIVTIGNRASFVHTMVYLYLLRYSLFSASVKTVAKITVIYPWQKPFAYLHILLLSLSMMILGCNRPEESASSDIPEYPVLTLVPRQVTLFTNYPVTIQGYQNVEIRPRIDGYIETIYVDEGAIVQKGDPLFQINAPQYEQEVRTAEADIEIAQADLQAAEMEVERIRPLVEKSIIGNYELESAKSTLKSRMASLAQAEARLANARTNLGYTKINSPTNGVIGEIPHRIGSLVSSNMAEPLTTVSNVERFYAYLSINEKQFLDFRENSTDTTLEGRVESLPPVKLLLANGTEFPRPGTIVPGSGIIDTQTGSLSIRASFENINYLVRSGSSGTLMIPQTYDSALLIPQKATFELQGERFAYVVQDTNTVQSVSIEVADNDDGQFFIVEEGLQPGNKVVVEGIGSLRDGAQINPKTVNADRLYRESDH